MYWSNSICVNVPLNMFVLCFHWRWTNGVLELHSKEKPQSLLTYGKILLQPITLNLWENLVATGTGHSLQNFTLQNFTLVEKEGKHLKQMQITFHELFLPNIKTYFILTVNFVTTGRPFRWNIRIVFDLVKLISILFHWHFKLVLYYEVRLGF